MRFLRKILQLATIAITIAVISACTFPVRTGYDRSIGDYKPVPSQSNESDTTQSAKDALAQQEKNSDSLSKQTSAGRVKYLANQKSKSQPPRKQTGLEKYASEWLGAKYVYGAASKNKTDCSGFVMQVYKGYYNIALAHNASKMYEDSRASSVGRGKLREGDLVFFGSFWKIDHVGIYLSGDRFIHASSSKGVIISPMNDKYWSPKYQGARRFL